MNEKEKCHFKGCNFALLLLVIAAVLLARYWGLFTLSWYWTIPISLVVAATIAYLLSTITSPSGSFDRGGVHHLLGLQYGSEGKFTEAQAELKKTLEIDPFDWATKAVMELTEDAVKEKIKKQAAIHIFKALLFSSGRKYQDAIGEYKRAIAIDSNYAQLYNALGCIYGQQGMVDEEISALKKAIAINPNYAWAYNNLGWACHKHKGMIDEAIVQYKKAIAIDADYAEAHNNLGLAYGEKEMIDEAISELHEAVDINPNLASAHNDLALGYFSKQQFKLAIKHADKATELGAKVHPEFIKMLKRYR